jgi:hypothetical protein
MIDGLENGLNWPNKRGRAEKRTIPENNVESSGKYEGMRI